MANTNLIGLKDLRENTEEYINKVKRGREFTVVRKSKPVFKIAPVDAWGDEGIWEIVADFRALNEKGVPARDVLRSLRKNNGSRR
ncbi:hypothetical protein A3B05_02490 [Candidatus Giovannonibacteria bacterium RIFCSPLOWO2_01_FULL_43_160]|uniref:Antitoxin n=2 Tax=Candidatus Giovannoniibacteriota TaxID=1752738 RepID=A0A0G1LTA7_9BACT|nr:MAG: hypothetical protein UV72_C0002G0015 [Candidatus Giovannonibacteria bacterium GW2011_GWB1_43_13]KKS99183.1 MAG: hypothetical protein UV75_C0008G0017 [Candidatus Giovannonibacteria bacterium GW2011_GWA1_43_15]KKT21286.1 MAG: hypothetical protein UW05_C0013G0005 [Candidatus Giovannonibacteria bacterium GW2011_GWC2_43_8]KKT62984.1 MAG: hypothetical protein UW55_C0007G0024 [Candidatus Giovannonibacteria bacterium GW2011_GWA2_44_26]OGF58446.1 MAG: hypothetical protein A2652_01590 [Candidatus